MVKQKVLKVKDGMLDEWLLWCSELQNKRYEEARLTLIEEGLEIEMSGVFQLQGSNYVIATVIGEALPSDQNKEINQLHREKRKKCLEPLGDIDISYLIRG